MNETCFTKKAAWASAFLLALTLAPAPPAAAQTAPLDSQVISIDVNGSPYTAASPPFSIPADHVFMITIVMENTGTISWEATRTATTAGATLLSRGPPDGDYNTTFGTYLISPGQHLAAAPGETYTYIGALRAPSQPGLYTMVWQLADWIIPDMQWAPYTSYTTAPFFGEAASVQVQVTDPTPAPPARPHQPGVLDIGDFEYVGSFVPPNVPNPVDGDEKAFYQSGITLRTVNGEKRMILGTGTYKQTLYELAIPDRLGKIVGSDVSAVPTAQLRNVFGELTKQTTGEGPTAGSMWYDPSSNLLYWSNYDWYYNGNGTGILEFPLLRAGTLDNGVLTQVQQWNQPYDLHGAPFKSFWGGVTNIPAGFAARYTGGRTLGIGFGGVFSIDASCSFGPAIAAASASPAGGDLDLLPIIYSSINTHTVRDGNYFSTRQPYSPNPTDPWSGLWTQNDSVRTGVFIDLPDKKGYVTFARQGIERLSYDWAGSLWQGKSQNTWYFYSFDMLGQAALNPALRLAPLPSSYATVNLPYDPTSADQVITGSAFDPSTRLLYVYSLKAYQAPGSMYANPLVHVYFVKLAGPAAGSIQPIPLSPAMLALLAAALALGAGVALRQKRRRAP